MFLLFILFSEIDECARTKFPQKVVVFDFEQIGAEVSEITSTLSVLFRSELRRCPKYKVVNEIVMKEVLGERNLVPEDREDLFAKCRKLKARFGIEGMVLKLSNKIIITVNLIDTVLKGEIFSERITSLSLEDLDLVIKRLATAVCLQEKVESQVTVETITEEEAKPKRRRQTCHLVGVKLGPLFPIDGSYGRKVKERMRELGEEVKRLTGISFCYAVELARWMVEIEGDVYREEPASYIGIMVKLYRFNSVTDFSSFLKGGVGLGWMTKVDSLQREPWGVSPFPENRDGLTLEVGGGVMMFRTYDFHIVGEIAYNVLLDKDYPQGIFFKLGVLYKTSQKWWKFLISLLKTADDLTW